MLYPAPYPFVHDAASRRALATPVERTRRFVSENIDDLHGNNLACCCKPGVPCHPDVLLEVANRTQCGKVDR
ncbi:DUF4326 domain-containing protein [Ensifer aridi]|uniref:DUF4326 domain-containing protein n=1 Tax=Ensifer aridi TaxID=1708715 RepID=UPI000A10E424